MMADLPIALAMRPLAIEPLADQVPGLVMALLDATVAEDSARPPEAASLRWEALPIAEAASGTYSRARRCDRGNDVAE